MENHSDSKSPLTLNYKFKKPNWRILQVGRLQDYAWVIIRALLIIGISYVILYPILIKLSIAFKDKVDIYNPNVVWLPRNLTLDNFVMALKILDYWPTITNTLILCLVTMMLQTVASALAGYGFARFSFWGRNLLFAMVILTILMPPQTLMVPLYLHFKEFDVLNIYTLVTGNEGVNLINTLWPSFLMSLTANGLKSGLYIYIFRQFFRNAPKEIEESAFIDGASVLKTFTRIILPISVPAIVTVMLFSFVWQWNDLFMTSIFMNQSDVISIKITTLGNNAAKIIGATYGNDPNFKLDPYYQSMLVSTGVLLAIAPLIVMYLFVQRLFVESVERTGVVG
jgi:ABC-type glycerol-3-phosphate transport system permease component